MIGQFKGPYSYDYDTINDWNSDVKGVYECGKLNSENKLIIMYVGKATGDYGIPGRLLQHINENKWQDVTHFGYHQCDTENEALDFEAAEIEKYKPKYNKQGK